MDVDVDRDGRYVHTHTHIYICMVSFHPESGYIISRS